MFFQDTPPDTSAYMIAGYIVFFVVMAIYLVSLFIRSRNLHQDLKVLESLQRQGQAAAGKPERVSQPDRTKKKASRKK